MFIKHRQYNTSHNTQIENQREIKTSFCWGKEWKHIDPDRVMIQLIFTHKANKDKRRGKIYIMLQTGKEGMHQEFTLDEYMWNIGRTLRAK